MRVRTALSAALIAGLVPLAGCSSASGPATASATWASPSVSGSVAPSSRRLDELPPDCVAATEGFDEFYAQASSMAGAFTPERRLTPKRIEELTAMANTLSDAADKLGQGPSGAPSGYEVLIDTMRAQASILLAWPQDHGTTGGLAESLDAAVSSDAGIRSSMADAVTFLERECSPWTYR